jgi:hypothetical protein
MAKVSLYTSWLKIGAERGAVFTKKGFATIHGPLQDFGNYTIASR